MFDPNQALWQIHDLTLARDSLQYDVVTLEETGEYPHHYASDEMYRWLKDYGVPPSVFLEQPAWAIDDIRYLRKVELLYDFDVAIEQYKAPKIDKIEDGY